MRKLLLEVDTLQNSSSDKESKKDDINSLEQQYQSGTLTEKENALIQLFVINGIKQEESEKFVRSNISVFYTEIRVYGFNPTNNPLFSFIIYYNNSNKTISPFFDENNYAVLHNVLAQRILSPNEVAMRVADENQIKILLNPSFWSTGKQQDKIWLIQLYVWLSFGQEVKKNIINDAVLLSICPLINLSSVKIDFVENDEGEIESDEVNEDKLREIYEALQKDVNNVSIFQSKQFIDQLRYGIIFSDTILRKSKECITLLRRYDSLIGNLDNAFTKLANLEILSKELMTNYNFDDNRKKWVEDTLYSLTGQRYDLNKVDRTELINNVVTKKINDYEINIKNFIDSLIKFNDDSLNELSNGTIKSFASAPLVPLKIINETVLNLNANIKFNDRNTKTGQFDSINTGGRFNSDKNQVAKDNTKQVSSNNPDVQRAKQFLKDIGVSNDPKILKQIVDNSNRTIQETQNLINVLETNPNSLQSY